MPKILIIYDSKTGNTKEMAIAVGEGAKKTGAEVDVIHVKNAKLSALETADAIIFGSPTYFGTMTADLKKFIDESVSIRRKLENKIGAAFSSSAAADGGNETTIFSLIQAMLIHGMLIVGDPISAGGHYGVVAVGSPNSKVLEKCRALGERVAKLTNKLITSAT